MLSFWLIFCSSMTYLSIFTTFSFCLGVASGLFLFKSRNFSNLSSSSSYFLPPSSILKQFYFFLEGYVTILSPYLGYLSLEKMLVWGLRTYDLYGCGGECQFYLMRWGMAQEGVLLVLELQVQGCEAMWSMYLKGRIIFDILSLWLSQCLRPQLEQRLVSPTIGKFNLYDQIVF